MKNLKETKTLNLQRRRRKLADLLEKERLEHTVSAYGLPFFGQDGSQLIYMIVRCIVDVIVKYVLQILPRTLRVHEDFFCFARHLEFLIRHLIEFNIFKIRQTCL